MRPFAAVGLAALAAPLPFVRLPVRLGALRRHGRLTLLLHVRLALRVHVRLSVWRLP